MYIGSFNFDPRSSLLNTENGVVIESPVLARAFGRLFDAVVPARHWQVMLDAEGELVWLERGAGSQRVHRTEPRTGWVSRLWVWLVSLLPIEPFL